MTSQHIVIPYCHKANMKSIFLVLFSLSLAHFQRLASACSTEEDCNLNGVCTSNLCVCATPWKGSDCGELDLLPANAPDGALYRQPNISSWCASTVHDDVTGLWHAVVAQMSDNCGLNSWESNSQLVHVVSETGPTGPYVNESLIRLPFSHNPKLIKAPDGSYLIFHIGCGDNSTKRMGPCTGGVTPNPPPPPPQRYFNGGACLAPSNGKFPQWVSPQGWPMSPLVLVNDNSICTGNASLWSAENSFISAEWPAIINLDCNACSEGSPLKVLGGQGSSGSGLIFNATAGVLQLTSCSNMCVSNGGVGAHKPCGSSSEPYLPSQLHAISCDSPDAKGWSSTKMLEDDDADPNCGIQDTEILYAPSLDGPWTFQTAFGPNATGSHPFFPSSVDNPAPFFYPNGSIGVMFRSYTRASAQYHSSIGIAYADSWKGPWTLPTEPIFPGLEEDPFFWYQNNTNSFHAIFHNMGGCKDVGCHAFSKDGLSWTLSKNPCYSYNVSFTDGKEKVFSRRERPQLVFDPATGVPTHLINGVQLPRDEQPKEGQQDYTYSIIVPLRV